MKPLKTLEQRHVVDDDDIEVFVRLSGARRNATGSRLGLNFDLKTAFFFLGTAAIILVTPLLLLLSVVPDSADSDANHSLVKRIKTTISSGKSELSSEMERVKRYEEKLRKRALALEVILGELGGGGELSFNFLPDPNASANTYPMAVGGGRESNSDLVSSGDSISNTYSEIENETQPADLIAVIDNQISRLSSLPVGVPVPGDISSPYGMRRSPFSRRRQLHNGIDFSVEHRTTVTATADGVVKRAGYIGAYGRTVVVDHGNGFETVYGHLSRLEVKAGQRVCRGQTIGLVGSTGRSTGPHVHYEVRKDGKAQNPAPFVSAATFLDRISS